MMLHKDFTSMTCSFIRPMAGTDGLLPTYSRRLASTEILLRRTVALG
jgi:hypothetical protein